MLNIKQMHQHILKEKGKTNQEWEEEQKSKLLNAIAIKSDRKLLNTVFDMFREKEIFEHIANIMLQEGYSHPTEFEILTSIGFMYFKEQKIDFLVLETG